MSPVPIKKDGHAMQRAASCHPAFVGLSMDRASTGEDCAGAVYAHSCGVVLTMHHQMPCVAQRLYGRLSYHRIDIYKALRHVEYFNL